MEGPNDAADIAPGSRPMNILVINWQDWTNPMSGGAELNLHEIFSRLARKGHHITLLCSRWENQKRHEVMDGIEIFRIGKRHNFNFFVPHATRVLTRRTRPDIIVDDLNKIPFYSPFIVKKRVVPFLHHLFRGTIYRETNFLFASYVFLAERAIPLFYRNCTFVAVSKSSAQDLREIGVRNRISIIYNGVDAIENIRGTVRQDNLVAYVGRVMKYKSIGHFIEALKIIQKSRDVEAVVVGDGDAMENLAALARRLNVRVRFAGFVSGAEKIKIYSSARVVVQPSVKEGWGLTAIEAQACGTPVVCADSPGLNEVVIHGKTGLLYPYGNIKAFADSVLQLLTDGEKWTEMSLAARAWAKKFTWDNSADQLEKVLIEEATGK